MRISRNMVLLSLVAIPIVGYGLFWWFYPSPESTVFPPPWPPTNAENHPIRAVFQGRIPCVGIAGCEKIKFALSLYQNPQTQAPSTYWLGRILVAVGNDRHVAQGSVQMRRGIKGYPEAVVLELDQNAPEDSRLYWQVNDDVILPLDKEMKPKVGNAGWGYMLSRTH